MFTDEVKTMTNEILEAVEELQKEISEKEETVALIKSLDLSKPVTEDVWRRLCETSLRTSSVMAELVKSTFPEAKNINVHSNSVHFRLYDFHIVIPTWNKTGIHVDTAWYQKEGIVPFNRYCKTTRRVMRTIEFMKIDNPTYNDYLELVYGYQEPGITDKPACFKKMFYLCYKKSIHEQVNDALDEAKSVQKSYDAYISNSKKESKEVDERVALMKEKLLPELKRFSKTICGWDRDVFYNAYSPNQIIRMNEASALESET